jgi:ABC-type branched-subunit amino acid transport system ATPase component
MAAAPPKTISLEQLSAGYVDDFKVLNAVSMVFQTRKITLLVGPNGSGKSTVLKSIAGLCRILDGKVTLDGADVTHKSVREMFLRGIAYVPADNRVFPDISVRGNLEVVLTATSMAERNHRIESIFSRFPAVAAKQTSLASSLSGGEQQILSIARAVLGGASALLLDEPTSGLSPRIANEIAEEIERLNEAGVLFIIAEHNLAWATRICTDFYALRDGVLMDSGATSGFATDIERVRRIFL